MDHLTKMGVLQLHNPTLPATLLHRANHMRLSGTLCDVIITVDGQEFPAHRTVLACTSKMFEILFHRSSLRYALDFLSPKTFQQILEYAYTASLQATAEDLDDLLYAAEILEIEYLEEQCLKVLETIQSEEKQDHLSLSGRNHGSGESEQSRARHWRNMLISKKHAMQEGGINPTALHHLALYHMTDRSPSGPGGLPMGLPVASPTQDGGVSLEGLGQSPLQYSLNGAQEPFLPLAKRIKTEDNNMQVDEANGRSNSGGEGGCESDQPREEGPGTPQRGSVITSAREQHSGQEEGGIVGNNSPLDSFPGLAEKHLASLYSSMPSNHIGEVGLPMPMSVAPSLAMSLDLRAYGGLLNQGLLHREILSRLGQFAAGMRREGQSQTQSSGDCGLQLHDREVMEQHSCTVKERRNTAVSFVANTSWTVYGSGCTCSLTQLELRPWCVISVELHSLLKMLWRPTDRHTQGQTWQCSVCSVPSGSRPRRLCSSTWRFIQGCTATSAATVTTPSPATPPSNATCAHTQVTTRLSVSSVGAVSGTMAC
uniref:Zinc finger and BTB domain containing 16 n=1 Tax=Oncorhynchus kisutch TaxID=8019 RepID=A0A8C7GRA5_ONCKI